MKGYITSDSMVEIYGLTRGSLDAFNHYFKETEFVHKDSKGRTHFNIKAMEAIRHRRKRVWLDSHDYFFWFTIEGGFNESTLAKQVFKDTGIGTFASWSVFLNRSLFSSVEDISILAVVSKSKYLFAFHEWCEKNYKKHKNEFEVITKEDEKCTERMFDIPIDTFKARLASSEIKALSIRKKMIASEVEKNKRLYQEMIDEENQELAVAC